jgi:hypothetical protein
MVVFRPSTAWATTWTSIPLSTTVANAPKNVPRYPAAVATSGPAGLPESESSAPRPDPKLSCPSAASTRLSTAGTTMNSVMTPAERPTMALGLRRIVLNAPS